MTRVAPATVAYPAVAPPAQGPPGRASRDDFAPVLRSEGRKPDPDTSETSARTAGAEGTTPRADDPGADRPDRTEGRRLDGPHDDRPDHDSNGVGKEVSEAAHRAHEEGASVSESVHAALRAARGDADPAPVDPLPVDPSPTGPLPGTEADGAPAPPVVVVEPVPAVPIEVVVIPAETEPVPAEIPAEASTAETPTPVRTTTAQVAVTGAESTEPAAAQPAGVAIPAEPSAPVVEASTVAPTGGEPGAEPDPGDGDPTMAASRPGHLPEHGRGGVMRREDPPAIGWNRRQAEEAGDRPATAPVGPQPPAPAEAEPATPAAQPAQGTAAATAPAPLPTGERLPVTRTEMPLRAGSRLAELADTFRTVVRVAAQEGRTEARITLHPADLGEVQIRLRYEHGGVSADVLADSRQAAQTLQQSVSDLRRTLEAQGMNVLWLDVRHGGQEQPAWLNAQGRAGGDGTQSSDPEDEPTGREIPVGRLDDSGSILDVLA